MTIISRTKFQYNQDEAFRIVYKGYIITKGDLCCLITGPGTLMPKWTRDKASAFELIDFITSWGTK